MIPNPAFLNRPKSFWAYVRTLSQKIGYVERARRIKGVAGPLGPIKVPTLAEVVAALEGLRLTARQVVNASGNATPLGRDLLAYLDYRAEALNGQVKSLLMNVDQARAMFASITQEVQSQRAVPLNKQGNEKKAPAYFTGMVNLLIEANLEGLPCDYAPGQLTTITKDDAPFRTLARRIDGAFPAPVNPIAVWEIKEYYYTTTFGSRVADGVYESLLDGMELEEIRTDTKGAVDVKHYLMVDAYYTWWVKGRSYLCRLIDMLHMGYVDEILFGSEIAQRLPSLAQEWVRCYRASTGRR